MEWLCRMLNFFAIASLIRKEYMQIETKPITHELEEKQDELIETILDFLCQYITQNKIEPKNEFILSFRLWISTIF